MIFLLWDKTSSMFAEADMKLISHIIIVQKLIIKIGISMDSIKMSIP